MPSTIWICYQDSSLIGYFHISDLCLIFCVSFLFLFFECSGMSEMPNMQHDINNKYFPYSTVHDYDVFHSV